MPTWRKSLTKEAVREAVSQFIWSYWPIWGAPIVSVILSVLGGYSPLIIFMCAIGAFAIMAVALNSFSQWFAERTAADKLQIAAPVALAKPTGSPPSLEGLKLGVHVQNKARFPLDVRIDKLEIKILDRVPITDFFERTIEVGQGDGAHFNNALIDLSDLERANALIYGRIEAKVSYGRKGDIRHKVSKQWNLAIKFDRNGELQHIEPNLTDFGDEVARRL